MMRGTPYAVVALIAVVGATICSAQDGFKWVITDRGTERDLKRVDATECVRALGLKDSRGTYSGSCVHIGKGWFLTVGHGLRYAQGRTFLLDNEQVTVSKWQTSTDDFGFMVIPSRAQLPSISWSQKTPRPGSPVTIIGKATGRTAGLVMPLKLGSGEITVEIAPDEKMTTHGDSGGAVIDSSGNLVGILTSFLTEEDRTVSFVPLNRVAQLLGKQPVVETPADTAASSTYAMLFTASWCVPCKTARTTVKPQVEKGGWTVQEVDVDIRRDLVKEYKIKSIPAWVFIKDGEEVSRLVGTGVPNLPKATAADVQPETEVCRCLGYKEHLCFCRQRGQQCACSTTKGSIWEMDEQGKPVKKTGQYTTP